jgi:serine/threonine-protein kinase
MRFPNGADRCFIDGGELTSLPDPRIGTLLAGRYLIEEPIGEGGMAIVYRARHKLVERDVAVKVMNPILASDPVVRERFRREARSAQKLAHPNIIEIFDQGDTEDGTSYIVMELLRGEPLSAFIRRRDFDVDRAVSVMVQIARGIARAHDLEVVHRDLKPENIFLSRAEDGGDIVKLLDFGIAKSRAEPQLTAQGELFGTPQYMAPERIMGAEAGSASDLYALGVVFFEMLVGELPFDAADIASFFAMHMHETPPRLRSRHPLVPLALDDLIFRMLAKAPEDRPADAHRVHAALVEILQARDISPPTDAEYTSSWNPEKPTDLHAPTTLAAGATDGWARRIFVLERMLGAAFGSRREAPAALNALFDNVNEGVRALAEAKERSFEAQTRLEEIESRGREKRAQLGAAVDHLGLDSSLAKEDLRTAREAERAALHACEQERERYALAHAQMLRWEGRSAFAQPWPDLAAAYRATADVVDAWCDAQGAHERATEHANVRERAASDLDFQVRELRAALAKHEHELDEEREKCRRGMLEESARADKHERTLVADMARFCEPLRARRELAPFFKELEIESATSA